MFLSSLGSIQPGQQFISLQSLFHSQYQPLLSQVPIYPWVKRSNYSKVSCSRTQVSRSGFEPTLWWLSTRTWIRCSQPLGHDTLLVVESGRVSDSSMSSSRFPMWCIIIIWYIQKFNTFRFCSISTADEVLNRSFLYRFGYLLLSIEVAKSKYFTAWVWGKYIVFVFTKRWSRRNLVTTSHLVSISYTDKACKQQQTF